MKSSLTPVLYQATHVITDKIETLGHFLMFTSEALRKTIYPLVDRNLLIAQLEFVGVRSLGVIILAALIVGAVFGIQFGIVFKMFGAESLIGAAASFALSKELAPVVGSFLITGRAGSAMAAEIGTMRVNDQVDALKVMAVNPIGYLVSPRILASMIMTPLLSAIFVVFGVLASYFVAVQLFQTDPGVLVDKLNWITTPKDVIDGLEKAFIFGTIFSTIACYKGYYTTGGAKGVGKSTTEAVVWALVIILISDFFITSFQL